MTEIEGFSYKALSQLSFEMREVGKDTPLPSVDLSEVAWAISSLQNSIEQRLDKLVDLTSNPTAAAGAELLRRGILAWSHSWWEDALRDLESAIASYPYRATSVSLSGPRLSCTRKHGGRRNKFSEVSPVWRGCRR